MRLLRMGGQYYFWHYIICNKLIWIWNNETKVISTSSWYDLRVWKSYVQQNVKEKNIVYVVAASERVWREENRVIFLTIISKFSFTIVKVQKSIQIGNFFPQLSKLWWVKEKLYYLRFFLMKGVPCVIKV